METALATQNPTSTNLALLFTNHAGEVVFADVNFLRIMNCPSAGLVVGEPLHQVLHIDQATASGLIEELRSTGHVRERVLDLEDFSGTQRQMACTGVATYNNDGSFIGADIALSEPGNGSRTSAAISNHGDVINTRIQQVLDEAQFSEDKGFLELYCTAQVEALQVLLIRLMGLWVRDQVEAVTNQTAQQNNWSIQMQDGLLSIDTKATDSETYGQLLAEVVNYAVDIIGEQVVRHEMQTVDNQMDAKVRELASQSGLRDIVIGQS